LGIGAAVKRLGTQLDSLRRLRDAQVQMEEVAAAAAAQPQLAGFLDHLSRFESALRAQLPHALGAIEPAVLEAALQPAQLQLGSSPTAMATLSNALRRNWRRRRKSLIGRRQVLEPGDPATIHRLRIAFKKYRYLAEAVQPLLLAATPEVMKAMHAYQQAMGQIQDQAVLVRQLEAWLRKAGSADQALFRYLRERRNELDANARRFVSDTKQLDEFLSLR
jgi:CHAD domain-containing protein